MLTIFLFLSAAVILTGIFDYGFSIWSIIASFTRWTGGEMIGEFVGLKNYSELIYDYVFVKSFMNTLILMGIYVIATTLLGLFLASLLHVGLKGSSVFKVIYLIPLSFSFPVSAAMWAWMYTPERGVINTILRSINLDFLTQPWTSSPSQSLLCIAIAYVWQFSGFATIIYYAGLQAVPPELAEAAEIDGASTFQKYIYVYWPLQKSTTVSVLAVLLIYALRIFDLPWLLTGGGPAHSSEVLSVYIYRTTYNQYAFGYGAAIGIIMLIIAIVTVVPVLRVTVTKRGA